MVSLHIKSFKADESQTRAKEITLIDDYKKEEYTLGLDYPTKLYAWVHDDTIDSYIYTKSIPTAAGSVTVLTSNPLAEATGTFTPGDPEATPATVDTITVSTVDYVRDSTKDIEV